jgi:asparagine synthase (glutamine-hydrolysing)
VKSFLYFLLPKKIKTKVRVSEKGYILPEFVKKYKNKNAIADNLYGSSGLQEALINHFEYKLEHLLKWEDRNSMWFSIEARVPFLDHRLVEKTLSLPGNEMIRKGMTKHILRESMRGILPERIRVRKDKIGFGTPQDEWFRTPKLHALVQNILLSESFAKRGIIDVGKAKSLFHQHMNREINISKEIWKWLHLELWFREFIDPSINISDANIN